MKLAALTLALFCSSATAVTIRSHSIASSLLSKARKLEDGQQEEEEENAFLYKYSVKLIGCATGEKYLDPEDGNYEYSSVVFRLCPAESCDDSSSVGCSSGYGDYVVGINSFTDAWLEDKKENMQQDDNFNVEEYAECREYEVENQDGNNNNGEEQAAYYVGPACGEGNTIKLGFFSDYMCTTVPEDVTFEDISNGWNLPYSSGLVSSNCEACAAYNDKGEYGLSELCEGLYENAGKCETNMEYLSANGATTSSCDYIAQISPKITVSKSSGGKVFGWIVFLLIIGGVGFYAYSVWWRKKKSGSAADGLMN